jgi:LCP family protein required for cell wall assembly
MARSINKNRNKKRNKKARLVRRFISTVFLIVFSFLVLAGIGTASYLHFAGGSKNPGGDVTQGEEKDKGGLDFLKPKKIKTNVVVFGLDKDQTRTDVIFVVNFDSKTKKMNLLSVPRDTRVFLTDEMLQDMRSHNRRVPDTVKMNEVHAYAGKEKANEYSVKEIERLLGIDIDYYVTVNIDAFRKIVDAMGGIEMDLPRNFYYVDNAQGLYINLKKGPQTLNGAQAEQLVRFRKGYANGDLGRIEMQQVFLKAFAKKALSPKNILNLPNIIKTLYDDIQTNFGLDDVLKYMKYVDDVDLSNLRMERLPGDSRTIGHISYFIHDDQKTQALVQELFFDQGKESTDSGNIDSKNLNIAVLNGGAVGGLAQKTGDRLKAEGYTIKQIGNYNGEREDETRIFVSEEGIGKDLEKYFENSMVIVDSKQLGENIDIQIVLGLKEK